MIQAWQSGFRSSRFLRRSCARIGLPEQARTGCNTGLPLRLRCQIRLARRLNARFCRWCISLDTFGLLRIDWPTLSRHALPHGARRMGQAFERQKSAKYGPSLSFLRSAQISRTSSPHGQSFPIIVSLYFPRSNRSFRRHASVPPGWKTLSRIAFSACRLVKIFMDARGKG